MYDSYDEENYEDDNAEEWLEPCPSCGKMVFEDSPQCPSCGEYIIHRRRGPFSNKPAWFFVLAVGIVIWLIITML